MTTWLALMIGNSRLHWAWFEANQIRHTWDTAHFTETAIATSLSLSSPPLPLPPQLDNPALRLASLVVASVVPSQTRMWLNYPNVVELTLDHVALNNLYPTLGIDRALAVLGAFTHWQSSVLVIDAGTALTFTAVDDTGTLVGGAIAPGLQLQLRSLHQHTAGLPDVSIDEIQSRSRWQTNTTNAILSGVWHMVLGGIQEFSQDWLRQCPDSHIVLTGGDGPMLYQGWLAQGYHWQARSLHYDPDVGFRGMAIARSAWLKQKAAIA